MNDHKKGLTTSGKVHRMGNRIVAIDTERHQDIGGRVRDPHLDEPYHLAGHVPGQPRDGNPLHDVRQHAQQTDAEICEGEKKERIVCKE